MRMDKKRQIHLDVFLVEKLFSVAFELADETGLSSRKTGSFVC